MLEKWKYTPSSSSVPPRKRPQGSGLEVIFKMKGALLIVVTSKVAETSRCTEVGTATVKIRHRDCQSDTAAEIKQFATR